MVINAKEEINERRNHTEHSFDESNRSQNYVDDETNKSRILAADETEHYSGTNLYQNLLYATTEDDSVQICSVFRSSYKKTRNDTEQVS